MIATNQTKYTLEDYKHGMEVMKDILDTDYQGMVLVDSKGIIVGFYYEKLLGIKKEDAIGKDVEDVVENTRLKIVMATGKEEMNDIHRIQGRETIASRVPIFKDGKVIGALGSIIFNDVRALVPLIEKVKTYEKAVVKYRGELTSMHGAKYSLDNIITQNKRMEQLKEIAGKCAANDSTVLIQGESGTGKEYFAHAIHIASYRRHEPFVRLNCAAIPRDLFEAELFGYDGGAFTSAKNEGKLGKLEIANGGTVLFDEIGAMPQEMQAKLLRVLEEREFERIGGTERIHLDIRVIASTNEDLAEAVKKGFFREDLYYRLNVIKLEIPPLRERLDDIPILSEYIIKDLAMRSRIRPKTIDPAAFEILQSYSWPGNVRELRNILESILNLVDSERIFPRDLPEFMQKLSAKSRSVESEEHLLKDILAKAEINAIQEAIEQCRGNKSKAADILGIHRTALYKKMNSYGLI